MADLTFKPGQHPEEDAVQQFLRDFAGGSNPIRELNTTSVALTEQVAKIRERDRILGILDNEEQRSGFDTIKISRLRTLINQDE